jgi:hypothetical protein
VPFGPPYVPCCVLYRVLYRISPVLVPSRCTRPVNFVCFVAQDIAPGSPAAVGAVEFVDPVAGRGGALDRHALEASVSSKSDTLRKKLRTGLVVLVAAVIDEHTAALTSTPVMTPFTLPQTPKAQRLIALFDVFCGRVGGATWADDAKTFAFFVALLHHVFDASVAAALLEPALRLLATLHDMCIQSPLATSSDSFGEAESKLASFMVGGAACEMSPCRACGPPNPHECVFFLLFSTVEWKL